MLKWRSWSTNILGTIQRRNKENESISSTCKWRSIIILSHLIYHILGTHKLFQERQAYRHHLNPPPCRYISPQVTYYIRMCTAQMVFTLSCAEKRAITIPQVGHNQPTPSRHLPPSSQPPSCQPGGIFTCDQDCPNWTALYICSHSVAVPELCRKLPEIVATTILPHSCLLIFRKRTSTVQNN